MTLLELEGEFEIAFKYNIYMNYVYTTLNILDHELPIKCDAFHYEYFDERHYFTSKVNV